MNFTPATDLDCLQSEPVSTAPESSQEQIVGFMDAEASEDVSMLPGTARAPLDTSSNASLKDFLSRPTRIFEYVWTEGTTIPETVIDPWTRFFTDATIVKKLDNYAYIKCDLNIKVVINASPFYYGAALLSYIPLPIFQPQPLSVGKTLVPCSQRPHIYLYPQNCQGGSLTLPFIYHKQWLETTALNMSQMGTLILESFDDLLNANSVVGSSCDISIYAWASDVELAGPSTLDALQSKAEDEYACEGAVSKPASAIARAANMLRDVPVIGPYMTATSMFSGSLAYMASLFGYSNVPNISDVPYYRPAAIPHLAATDIGKATEKLTLDSKNEVSIDPTIIGVKIDDELSIRNFVARESYYTAFDWASTKAPDELLWNVRVYSSPNIKTSFTGYDELSTTPLFMASALFKYWRGDIIYRFKIICSQYHKGRIEVAWCPNSTPGAQFNTSNRIYTKIFDITENNDIEFRVPYLQPTAYLLTNTTVGSTQFSTTPLSTDSTVSNGVLTVRVVNRQTAPVASATIKVLVFVRGAENIEFATPIDISNEFGAYTIQSQPVSYDVSSTSVDIGGEPTKTDSNINLIYHGESIVTMRTLLNRSMYFYRFGFSTLPADSSNAVRSITSRNPIYPGFDPLGIHSAIGIVSGVAEPYNYVNWHPLTWLSMCFLGNRGSIDYQLNPLTTSYSRLSMDRESKTRSVSNYDTITSNLNSLSASQRARHVVNIFSAGNSGMALTNTRTQSTLSASVPMYSNYKFLTNGIYDRTLGSSLDGSDRDTVTLLAESNSTSVSTNSGVDVYCSAGIDYSLLFFINTPTIYRMDSLPTAA